MAKTTESIIEEKTNLLQQRYWDYFVKRSNEYKLNGLTGRLVIDFQKGVINGVQDQAIIAGASVVGFYIDKTTPLDEQPLGL